jgi:hypothetical protein
MNIQEGDLGGTAVVRAGTVSIRPWFALLGGIWKLLRVKARIEIVEFAHSKTSYKVFNGFAYLLITLMAALVSGGCWLMFSLLRSAGLDSTLGVRETPALLLSAALVFSLPLSFALLIQEIFLSKVLPFLLTLPIPVRSVLAAKIIVSSIRWVVIFVVL